MSEHQGSDESPAATALIVGGVVLVVILLAGGFMAYVFMARAQVAERHMAQAHLSAVQAQLRAPAAARAAVDAQFARVDAATGSGELSAQEAGVFLRSITSSAKFSAGYLFAVADGLDGIEGLGDEERAAGRDTIARFAAGVLEGTLPTETAHEVARAAPEPGAPAEATRTWLANVEARCSALGLQTPAAPLDLVREVEQMVDARLGK
ncbi:MAG: hypothetical protein GY711_13745 [bacterium]|nr:hypothetical protein [bacterium]